MSSTVRIGLALAVFVVGCALLPSRQDSASLRDAYLVAHGMAVSYVERPDANPAVVQQLIVLDRRASAAMHDRDNSATAQAVAALTDFAASQARPDPSAMPGP